MWSDIGIGIGVVLAIVAIRDLLQKKHAIIRNFPVIGHFRYMIEAIGPELRQYIVAKNDEERPFSRDQRRWVYTSSKKQNNYFGFGTDNDLETAPGHIILRHSAFPVAPAAPDDQLHLIPCAKVMGGARGRAKAFRPDSVFSVSAMSFGSLSANAVQALNRGCAESRSLHNTGEGGISEHHRKGAGLIYQLGTGYFGARAPDGTFSMDRFLETVASADVRAVEVKLSQGAKPGKGGVLPAAKVTPEIARTRGIPVGEACLSPAHHTAFQDSSGLLDFVEELAERTGIPVGIKSAVGDIGFFEELAHQMETTGRGVDFIQIDGSEGGTGAAPLAFTDHVSMPFKLGFTQVWRTFAERGIQDDVVWIGSGKLGFPAPACLAFSLGCDMIGMAREPMLAIGCIQAQQCHTGHCPTGVATQGKWLMRGLDPTHKAYRMANFMVTLRKETLELCHAMGAEHPGLLSPDQFAILDDRFGSNSADTMFSYEPGWGHPAEGLRDELVTLMKRDADVA